MKVQTFQNTPIKETGRKLPQTLNREKEHLLSICVLDIGYMKCGLDVCAV